jgi:hypothetical protein
MIGLVIDGVGVATLRSLLLSRRQRRQRPLARPRRPVVSHRGRNSAAREGGRQQVVVVGGGHLVRQVVQNRHGLLVVRNDLEGDGHQIAGDRPDHLLLLQTPRVLVVAVVLVDVMLVVAAVLVRR